MKKVVEKKKKKKIVVHKNGRLKDEIVEKNKNVENFNGNFLNENLNVVQNSKDNFSDENLISLEELIDPLKKYEYIEDKKRINIKFIFYGLFFAVLIFLVIFSSCLINDKINDKNKVVDFNSKQTTAITSSTTSTKSVINSILSCSLDTSIQGVYQKNIIKFSFSNNSLIRYDNDYYVTLTDEASIEKYDELVGYLKIMALSLNDDVSIDTVEENYSYKLSAGVDLTSSEDGYGYTLGQSYNEVLDSMISLNYVCN